ncbi:MAG: hypothetical protein Q8Q73_13670 [Stagnimonas sp.]|nr:hypothetical protein [Stagnimonas sp.]
MRRALGLLVALLAACSAAPEAPAPVATAGDRLTDQVWLRADPGAAPGDLLAFLAGGALLMTSCGEPYRLARWQRQGDSLQWDEDGEPIRARLLALDGEALKLEFLLRGGPETKRYRASREARVCPDLPR